MTEVRRWRSETTRKVRCVNTDDAAYLPTYLPIYLPTYLPSFYTGKTPLHLAAQYGRRDTVVALLDRHAKVNRRSSVDKLTAAMLASKEGHKSTVSLLIARGMHDDDDDSDDDDDVDVDDDGDDDDSFSSSKHYSM